MSRFALPILASVLASLVSIQLLPAGSAFAAPIQLVLQVDHEDDDYKENSSGDTVAGDKTHDVWTDPDLKQAFRFTDVQIPPDRPIVSAILQLYATDFLDATISGIAQGEASGDAPAYANVDDEITNAPKTAATVDIENLPTWTDNAHNDIVDVGPIVQEIVKRDDWQQGNAMKIFLLPESGTDKRRTKTYDDQPERAAKLTISYLAPTQASLCPGSIELETGGNHGILDLGFVGTAHDRGAFVRGSLLTADVLSCDGVQPPCGECEFTGPIANTRALATRNRRCTNNTATACAVDASCGQQCVGGVNDRQSCAADSDCPSASCAAAGSCEFYLGSYQRLLTGSTTEVCVTNQVNGLVVGTADLDTGHLDVTIPLQSFTPPITQNNPCSLCEGDVAANDGAADGTCSAGPRLGRPCDVNGRLHLSQPGTSLDCPPATLGDPATTTIAGESTSLSAVLSDDLDLLPHTSPSCTSSGFSTLRCHCDTCDNLAATPCESHEDCVAVGATTCGGLRCLSGPNAGTPCSVNSDCGAGHTCDALGTKTKPNVCAGFTCTNGECAAGPFFGACALAPYAPCSIPADCADYKSCNGGPNDGEECAAASDCSPGSCDTGTCNFAPLACYNDGLVGDSIVADGSADIPTSETWDVTVSSLGCAGPTTDATVNDGVGLPGMTRLELPVRVSALQPNPIDVASPRGEICFGDGEGRFGCGQFATSWWGVALCDLDDDGRLDIVTGGSLLGTGKVCVANSASGGYDCSNLGLSPTLPIDVVAEDVDSDDVLDLVFASLEVPPENRMDQVCIGDGLGGFSCSQQDLFHPAPTALAVGDLNGDGHPDIASSHLGAANRRCLGDGAGSFACATVSADTNSTKDVAIGDLDGDTKPDLLFANTGAGPHRACLGDGLGGFTCSDAGTEADARTVDLGDFDEDGELDAVFGKWNLGRNRICFGDGAGGFSSCADVSADEHDTNEVVAADFDRDGHLDVLAANAVQSRICFGDGAGAFTCSDAPGRSTNDWGSGVAIHEHLAPAG